ncbi:MAG: helix-turn-helix domain-containing protein [Actinobacteria bacterium]|nr:helix-turn-helix domain-containing protein [Actinomycetota bacterium]
MRSLNEQGKTALMTIDEVAAYLQVPVQTLYTWRVRSKGPLAIKVGRHLRWRSADVEQWLLDQQDRRAV